MTPASLAALGTDDAGKLARDIVTPEGIPLRFTLARAGDRAAAFLLDVAILFAVLVAISLGLSLATAGAGSWLTAVILVLAFLLFHFYFAVFEVRWQGATPGKRKLGIRVIDARGGQLETGAVLARNLVRELEAWIPLRFLLAGDLVWPGAPGWARLLAGAWAFAFLFTPLFNKDRLRVGDLIAGTRVVVRPRVVLLPDLADDTRASTHPVLPGGAPALYTFTEAQLGFYGVYELQVLEGVLRSDPGSPAYVEAVRTVSEKVRRKIRYEAKDVDDERFLREFYAAQRAHLEQKLLFGQRRQDKYAK